ncbi:MAG: DUF2147 domain-containing protein [Burkholderiales bacterium]|jgi:uncharacterized protein (DUF2147 family)|nr:DUF2147 domain-containing protein [Burkholderiales bacterium]
MKTFSAFAGLLLSAGLASAQMSPVGTWRTIDDKTGEAKSEIRISESGGVLSGRVEKLLRTHVKQDQTCDECTDDRKGQRVLGMEIIRGAKKVEGRDVWEGGKILDPENGKEYTLRLTPVEGGAKMEVRGSILFIGRTQTWTRVQ